MNVFIWFISWLKPCWIFSTTFENTISFHFNPFLNLVNGYYATWPLTWPFTDRVKRMFHWLIQAEPYTECLGSETFQKAFHSQTCCLRVRSTQSSTDISSRYLCLVPVDVNTKNMDMKPNYSFKELWCALVNTSRYCLVFPATPTLQHDFTIQLGSSTITPSASVRNLGVIFDDQLTFKEHIAKTARSFRFALHNIRKIRPFLTEHAAQLLVQALSFLDWTTAMLF